MTKTRTLPWISTIIFAALFVVILVMAYTGNLPAELQAIPNYDKPGHIILYSVAAYLGHRILQKRRIRFLRMLIPLWILIFGTFTVVEEVIQGFSPNRSLDALDLVCSGLGIALGYWLAERED
ncbi:MULTISPECIES: VanZ family protein [unclassified Leptolyngbya]|uniref:VanZ family protein n=1 Tax=unclassified Leptolyngbya TaxID=2650499 RepID=UPI001F552D7E|nr:MULTISPECIES: VanZ family protein [unclassified Leptolyngbya]